MNPSGLCCGVRSGREVRERMAGSHLRGSHTLKDFIPETARGYNFCPNGLLELPHANEIFLLLFLFM